MRFFAAAWLALSFVWASAGCNFHISGPAHPSTGEDLASGDTADLAHGGPGPDLAHGADAAAPVDGGAPDLLAPDLAMPPLTLRIHVNGAAFTGKDYPGQWAADPGQGGVCSGTPYSTSAAIRGTADDALFQSEMAGSAAGSLTCAVHNLPAGKYTVTLLFAEIYWGPGCPGGGAGSGARVFDIVLEGQKVLEKLDLFALGHCAASSSDTKGKPVVKSFDVRVDDGTLDIALPASVNFGKISAIQIVSAGP